MKSEKKYVIKSKSGAFVEENSNGRELNYVFLSVEDVQKYKKGDLMKIRKKFEKQWIENEFEVYEITISLARSFNWIF